MGLFKLSVLGEIIVVGVLISFNAFRVCNNVTSFIHDNGNFVMSFFLGGYGR